MKKHTNLHYQVITNIAKSPIQTSQTFLDDHILYSFNNQKSLGSSGSMKVFEVFPGVELIYNEFSMPSCDYILHVTGNLLEINYCYEGREECQWLCGHYLYLSEGDLCITRMENNAPSFHFPTGRYRGITIVLDLDLLQENALPLLNLDQLNLKQFPDKFCPEHHFFAIRTNSQISHIFGELYQITSAFQQDYYKIKVLELLLFLSMMDPKQERRLEHVTENQIDIVKKVQKKLIQNLQANVTIEQLAKEFCISPTSLKSSFKKVYHTTIKEYLKKERMNHASFKLLHSDQTVAEIASSLGYVNQSKFASAFKSIYGLSPAEYRKKCLSECKN